MDGGIKVILPCFDGVRRKRRIKCALNCESATNGTLLPSVHDVPHFIFICRITIATQTTLDTLRPESRKAFKSAALGSRYITHCNHLLLCSISRYIRSWFIYRTFFSVSYPNQLLDFDSQLNQFLPLKANVAQ